MGQTEFVLSRNLLTRRKGRALRKPIKPISPSRSMFRALLLVLIAVLLGHWLTMLLFRQLYFGHWEPLIESAFVVATLFPVSYFYFFRPLVAQAEACHRAESEVREQARMLDLAHDVIVVRDLDGRVRFWNQGAQRFFGWTQAEVTGKKVGEFAYANPAQFQAINQSVLQTGEWQGEISVRAKDGRALFVNSRLTLIRDESGEPISVLSILWDVTEQKKLEAQFLRAQRLESIGVLAGGVAHDLNNILAPILMSAQILRMNSRDPESEEMLATIETSSQRGADIVKQLLTFARGVEGKRSPLQLKHLIKEVSKLIQETFPKNINLRLQTPGDLALVNADATQVHQVLMNLLVNARDAMPQGGVLTLSAKNVSAVSRATKVQRDAPPANFVLIEVADTGTGIAPEILAKIFDPFFTTKDLGKGTGLGLSTVVAIVKAHDGWVDVETKVGQGTTFKIYLPASVSEKLETSDPTESIESLGNGELILFVDDESSVCELAKYILEFKGYRIITAKNGADALKKLSGYSDLVRLVVTDLMMPVMDGATLVHKFREINPAIKIIVSTGLGEEMNTNAIANLNARQILLKPFTADQLLAAVHGALAENTSIQASRLVESI